MLRLSLFALLSLLSACAKRDNRPEWAKPPQTSVEGEGTIGGEPARVIRFAQKPNVDGKLDEPFWQQATALGPLGSPGNGEVNEKHPVAGFARVGWDDHNLYFGAVVGDKSPFTPFARDDLDPRLWEKSSAIELMVQPGDPGDNKGYYEIQIDTAGAIFDTRWDDYNQPIVGPEGETRRFGHMDWSCKAERAAHVEEGKFYSIEVAIPWSAFEGSRFAVPPKPGDVWRLNVYSFRDGQRLALGWSPIRGQGNFHKSSRFGRIKFE
jgi:hypothetical protein